MTSVFALPFVVSVLLFLGGRRLGAYLPPTVAVRLLTGLAVVVAAATVVDLSVAGGLVLAQAPWAAAVGEWSARRLRAEAGLPQAVGVAAGAVAVLLVLLTLFRAVRAGRALRRAAAAGRALGSSPVVVVEDDVPCAYAIAGGLGRRGWVAPFGSTGQVIVTTSMLQALTPDERVVLLAHECAHLRLHHHLYVQAAHLAAAANPLLRPVAEAVRTAVERSADEAAVAQVGDRRLVARSLARAALARSTTTRISAVLSATEGTVSARVRSLLEPAPRPRVLASLALVGLIGACGLSAAMTTEQGQDDIEAAEAWYAPSHAALQVTPAIRVAHPTYPMKYDGSPAALVRP